MSVVRNFLKKLPEVDWVWVKEDWLNDRVVVGPFTSPKLDKQRDRVLITEKRLDYIFKNCHLLYDHHNDPNEPVIVLGDCLAIGFDKSGKTFAAWGVYDGSETIDKHWSIIQDNGFNGGFSIGGKVPPGGRVCTGRECSMIDPEVLEVSYTTHPANQDSTVYYVNQFAKSVIEQVVTGPDTFEVKSELKKFDSKLEYLLKSVPEDDYGVDRFVKYPCVDSIMNGFMEIGLKKDEAKEVFQTHIDTIHKSLVAHTMTDKPIEEPTLEKEEIPAPAPGGATPGNPTIQLLTEIRDLLTRMSTPAQAAPVPGQAATPPPETGQMPDAQPQAEPPAGGAKPDDEQPSPDEKTPPEEDNKKPETEKKSTSNSSPLVETGGIGTGVGEKQSSGVTNPAGSTSEVVPDAPPEVKPTATETADETDPATEGVGDGNAPDTQTPPISKNMIRTPKKSDDFVAMMKKHGYITVRVDNRAPVEKKDKFTGRPVPDGEGTVRKTKLEKYREMMKNGQFKIRKE